MRIVAIVSVAAVPFACGVAHAQSNRVESVRASRAAELTEFWTEQRLRDAKAMPVPMLDPGVVGAAQEPRAGKLRTAQAKAPPNARAREVTMPPHWWTGRVLFAAAAGTIMSCAADLVAPGLVLTAAHCLRDNSTGQWVAKLVFVFDYQRDSGRRIPSECFATYHGWISQEPSRWGWDYGFVKIRGGTTIGHFGWESGWWGKQETAALVSGRPALPERPVPTGTLVKGWNEKIVGLKLKPDASAAGLTTGLKGGGWIGRYEEAGSNPQSNVVLSVTSHQVGDDSGTSYGPYWDDEFVRLMEYAKRGCQERG